MEPKGLDISGLL